MYNPKKLFALLLLPFLFFLFHLFTDFSGDNITLQVNEQETDFVPHIQNISAHSGGSYWDSSIVSLPCLPVDNGDKINLTFYTNPPDSITLMQYDIFITTLPLGASQSKSSANQIESEYNGQMLSFFIPSFDTEYQLIRCCCSWNLLFLERKIEYVFSVKSS